jgi:hypothetical protein
MGGDSHMFMTLLHSYKPREIERKRYVQNVYTIYPPDRTDKPSSDELDDLSINLQSFVFNVFGCIDNLAWIWVKEKQLKNKKGELLSGGSVGLMSEERNRIVRESFSRDFQDYLNRMKDWYKHLENFRHALAHRIPLYVPPYSLNHEGRRQPNVRNGPQDSLTHRVECDRGPIRALKSIGSL